MYYLVSFMVLNYPCSWGVSIVVIMVSIGTIIGAIAGYFGGKVEMVLMRLADIMLSFPGIVLAIAIAGILGGSIVNTILALSVVGWAKYARIVRSMTLKVRGEEYVTAAVMMGASTTAIIRRHIIPNIMPLVITTGALDIGAIMIEVAGLSFLGFGATAPTPEWGLMLNEGRTYMAKHHGCDLPRYCDRDLRRLSSTCLVTASVTFFDPRQE